MIWLPAAEEFDARLRQAKSLPADRQVSALRALSLQRLDFLQTSQLDRALLRAQAVLGVPLPGLEPVRLAVLGSSTTGHLLPGLRLAALRQGLSLELYEAPYGTYRQELLSERSALTAFQPQVILFALDARHLLALAQGGVEEAVDALRGCWQRAQSRFRCQVIQQTGLELFAPLAGSNEHRLAEAPSTVLRSLNEAMRRASEMTSVDLLSMENLTAQEGLRGCYDAALWHKSKQEVHPRAAALYGELALRLIAAARGRSAKCLVLDLDNTLWGGVIGDDGLEGIVLGQGSATGEAFAEFQRYVLSLSRRGVVLGVCSKNEEANALEAFDRHPEMLLGREQIACFRANWADKATNLREMARALNLGLDAFVFVDDNPVERSLVRRELPMVRVPEMPEDPAEFVQTLASAGYFEAVRFTAEDRCRAQQYRAGAERERLLEEATDMGTYLRSLQMVLAAGPVDALTLPRVTQLINKTNQFNLTTERLSEAEIHARAKSAEWITLQLRLEDRFGDNGLISVLMARCEGQDAEIASWLMSCRVLGREVERAALGLLVEEARARGVQRLRGSYRPTAKNGMVRDLYARLGFRAEAADGVEERWVLALDSFAEPEPLPFLVKRNEVAALA
ncbi:MAG: HAD-IIIC family phosphatase [Acidobacteriaceae bacterium]|nr:HAD-IIIC family phosphatase [Acidobacteriaceae bacterium]